MVVGIRGLTLGVPGGIPTGGAGFTPADLANIIDWWTTDGPSPPLVVGSGVDSWIGRIGGLKLAQSVDAKRPALTSSYLNGLDAVSSDGVDDRLSSSTGGSASQPIVYFYIGAWRTLQSLDFLLDGTTASPRNVIQSSTASPNTRYRLFAGTFSSESSQLIDLVDHYDVVTFDAASSSHRRDGAEIYGGGTVGTQGNQDISMFADNLDARQASFHMVEFGIVSDVLTAQELNDLESYLSVRGGGL